MNRPSRRGHVGPVRAPAVAGMLVLAVLHGVSAAPPRPAPPPVATNAEWVYLDNGQIRLGVKRTSGAAIGYLSLPGGTNLLNHFDQGRFVQQSYYGNKDGSMWAGKPWRWNPVQGGEYKGKPARLDDLRHDRTRLYAKTTPRNWAGGELLTNVIMEQAIALTGRVAHVRFRMTYNGTTEHVSTHHEIPALFMDYSLKTLVFYDGDKPWTGAPVKRVVPGWPNEGHRIAENWAAYVDDKDVGVGAYVPVSDRITSYRYGSGGKGSCSYFAPLIKFPIRPGTVFDYDLYLTIGTSGEIRDAFRAIRQARGSTPPPVPASK